MSSTAKKRFICRVVRLKLALVGEAAEPTGHVKNCPDCQAYFHTDILLENTLRHSAPAEKQPVPADLAATILRAVHQSTPPPRRSHVPAWTALAGATAVVALSFFATNRSVSMRPAPSQNQPPAELRPADIAKLVTNVDQLRLRLLNTVEPAAEKFTTENPLTQELQSARADARSALGFIALNFLPADSARRLESGPDSTHG